MLKINNVNIDFWYGNKIQDVARIDISFSDCDCEYRGNMYNADREMIGDFSTKDSVALEAVFPQLNFSW